MTTWPEESALSFSDCTEICLMDSITDSRRGVLMSAIEVILAKVSANFYSDFTLIIR